MTSLYTRFAVALGVGHAIGILMWVLLAAMVVPRVAEQHLAAILDAPTAVLAEQIGEAESARREALVADPRLGLTPPVRQADALLDDLWVVVAYPEVRVYRPVDADTWLALGPLPLVPDGASLRWVALALLVTAGVGSAAWLALRPVRRTLDRLAAVAKAFGSGDLTARARVTGPVELTQVGEAFDAMADRIHSLLRVQQETLQGVSHELRTPLTRARFALELVADTDAPDRRAQLAERASGNLDQMERLLDELLAYLRLDAPQEIATTSTDLRSLAVDAVESSEHRVAVTVRGEGTAAVEPRLWRRAVRNLVTNAVRHASGAVDVIVDVEGAWATVHVDDDGPGIPPEEQAGILQPFQRGSDARALDPSGSGLGLPIAARVARAHGGSLHIARSALGGARVSVTVPARRSATVLQ